MTPQGPERAHRLRRIIRAHKRWDTLFGVFGLLAMMLGVLTLAALFANMAIDGIPRLSADFFTSFPSRRPHQAGILSAWVGSALVMLVTAVVAVPVGIAGAIYLEEYARKNWFTDVIEINITNLAGVPSIVYGLLGLSIFINFMGMPRSASIVGGFVLALMTLPTIIRTSEEAIKSVSHSYREVALSLGATKWQAVWFVVLPAAAPGVLTGIILSLGRAIGETAALIFTAGSSLPSVSPRSLLDGTRTLSVHFYQLAREGISNERAYATAAILVVAISVINLGSSALMHRLARRQR